MYKNHIDLIGFIGSDPEARLTSNGTAVTTFSLATKSSWKNESGGYDSRTEWHRVVLWGKLADAAGKLAKGAYVQVEGEVRHRSCRKEIPAGKKAIAVDIPVAVNDTTAAYTSKHAHRCVRRASGLVLTSYS
jgi:single-strand DNA-binding protein